jgi:hypothetical protein
MILIIFLDACWGEVMWIIELNVAGYHFSREIPDLRRRPFKFNPRNVHWPTLRHSNAA